MSLSLRSGISSPAYDIANGWFRSLGAVPNARALAGTHSCDWLIVGGGACGLSTARSLALLRPQDSIVLLEASRVGFGASGRNAGFMLDHNTHGQTKQRDVTRRNNELCSAGTRMLRGLVSDHGIRCGWSEWGRIYASAGDLGDRHLAELRKDFSRDGVQFEEVSHEGMADLLGTRFYRGGLKLRGNGLVNPAALMRGLCESLPGNVEVFEETPVRAWRPGSRISVQTEGGEVLSRNVVFCTSVFSQEFAIARNRIAPVATFASLTEALPEPLLRSFGDREFAILPATENGSTIRLIDGNRLLIRNCFAYPEREGFTQQYLAGVAARHRQAMLARWPQLDGIAFSDTWSGQLGFTRNDGIQFGQAGPNVFYNISSDAAPVTRGTAVGKLLADKICGLPNQLIAVAEGAGKAALLPPRPILKYVVRHRIRAFERLGKEEF